MRFLRSIYLKLVRMNDTPQKIAVGLGIGVFFGVMPGFGPFVAVFFAFIFRVNRASALLGSVLTNTWLIIPTFLLAAKAGSMVTGASYKDIYSACQALTKDFRWDSLLKLSAYDIIIPVVVGYFVISLVTGIIAYLSALLLVNYINRKKIKKASL